VTNLVGNYSETLAAELALVLPQFAMHCGHVNREVARIREEFTTSLALGSQSGLG
jgi:hypothetical protein